MIRPISGMEDKDTIMCPRYLLTGGNIACLRGVDVSLLLDIVDAARDADIPLRSVERTRTEVIKE
jgi:hypothetical protein